MASPAALRLLAALAAGVLLAFAFPPSGGPAFLLALPFAFALIASAPGARAAAATGAAFAVGFFALHLAWLPVAFSALLSPFFWVTFPFLLAALAVYWAAAAAGARFLGGAGGGALLVLAPLWVGVELLRSVGFLGFPWGTLGYAWVGTPVAQWADLIGVHGLSLATTAAAAALAAPFVARLGSGRRGSTGGFGGGRGGGTPWLAPLATVALMIAAWTGGTARETAIATSLEPPDRTALLVQGNVDPFGRAISPRQELDVHLDLTAAGALRAGEAPDLVVWPEGAVLGFPLEGFRGEPARAAIEASAPGATFVVGGRGTAEGGGTNAVYLLREGQVHGRYDKHVLVPFGERWPLLQAAAPLYRAVFGLLNLPMLQNTVAGPGPTPLAPDDAALGAYVCYESVFPRIARGMVADGAQVLINVTNDAWFGRGIGAAQHHSMGTLRAIETRRWLLRAGNDGITAVVDPTGRTVERAPQGTEATLSVRYAQRDDRTPYVRFGGAVPWVVLGLTVAAVAASAAGRDRAPIGARR